MPANRFVLHGRTIAELTARRLDGLGYPDTNERMNFNSDFCVDGITQTLLNV